MLSPDFRSGERHGTELGTITLRRIGEVVLTHRPNAVPGQRLSIVDGIHSTHCAIVQCSVNAQGWLTVPTCFLLAGLKISVFAPLSSEAWLPRQQYLSCFPTGRKKKSQKTATAPPCYPTLSYCSSRVHTVRARYERSPAPTLLRSMISYIKATTCSSRVHTVRADTTGLETGALILSHRILTLVAVGFASAPNKKVRRFPVFSASRRSRLDPRLRLLASSLNQRLVVGSFFFGGS